MANEDDAFAITYFKNLRLRMRMKKAVLTPMTVVIAACALSACLDVPAQEPTKAPDVFPTVMVGASIARNDDNSPYLQEVYRTMEKVGQEQPTLSLKLASADNSQEKQYAQLNQMLAEGAKALVINLADYTKGEEVIKTYCDKVPLVFYNYHPGDKALASCKNAYFVDTDVPSGAIALGLSVLNHWKENKAWDKNGDGKIQLAIVEALPSELSSEARSTWTKSTIESYPNLGTETEVLFNDVALYQTHLAEELVNKWVAEPDFAKVEVVLSMSDSMSYGTLKALQAHNIKLPIFSIDRLSPTEEHIKKGEIIDAVATNFDAEMYTALRLAANLATNQDPMAGIAYRMEYKTIRVPYVTK